MLVKHIEMLNQISFLFMVLVIMAIHEKRLLRDNMRRGENSLARVMLREMNLNRFIFESDRACLDTTRMDRRAFGILCRMLREHGNLRRTKNMDIEEMVAMFLIIISHEEKNRIMRRLYARSIETISRQFNLVLNTVLRLQGILLKTPDPVPENSTDERWKWFKVTINVFGIYYIFTSFILMKFTYNLICLKELLRSTGWNLYQGQCACSR